MFYELYFDPGNDFDVFLNQHQKGKTVRYSAYTSFANKPMLSDDMNVKVLIRNSKKGRDISGIGLYEAEVLYERNASFKVNEKRKIRDTWVIELEETDD